MFPLEGVRVFKQEKVAVAVRNIADQGYFSSGFIIMRIVVGNLAVGGILVDFYDDLSVLVKIKIKLQVFAQCREGVFQGIYSIFRESGLPDVGDLEIGGRLPQSQCVSEPADGNADQDNAAEDVPL